MSIVTMVATILIGSVAVVALLPVTRRFIAGAPLDQGKLEGD